MCLVEAKSGILGGGIPVDFKVQPPQSALPLSNNNQCLLMTTSAVLLPVLQGRSLGDLLKDAAEVGDAVKAGILGNLGDLGV